MTHRVFCKSLNDHLWKVQTLWNNLRWPGPRWHCCSWSNAMERHLMPWSSLQNWPKAGMIFFQIKILSLSWTSFTCQFPRDVNVFVQDSSTYKFKFTTSPWIECIYFIPIDIVPYCLKGLKLNQSHLSNANCPRRPSRSCPSTGAELQKGTHVQGAQGDFWGDYPWTTGWFQFVSWGSCEKWWNEINVGQTTWPGTSESWRCPIHGSEDRSNCFKKTQEGKNQRTNCGWRGQENQDQVSCLGFPWFNILFMMSFTPKNDMWFHINYIAITQVEESN